MFCTQRFRVGIPHIDSGPQIFVVVEKVDAYFRLSKGLNHHFHK